VVRAVSAVAVLVMAGAISFGLASGDFGSEGAEILALAWGKVTLIDLYVGLALFGTWVAFRERSWVPTVVWWALLVVLGNLAATVYLAVAAFRSGDLGELLTGDRPC
jgi:hypothetical protein